MNRHFSVLNSKNFVKKYFYEFLYLEYFYCPHIQIKETNYVLELELEAQ